MRAALVAALLGLGLGGCLKAWDTGGPWACTEGLCPQGYTCDDGVCCVPGGAPACPTLPVEGQCPAGAPIFLVRDADGDGAGDEATRRPFCSAPRQERWVETAGDCDDGQAAIGPTAPERCNAIDDDCDGVVDDGLRLTTFYRDDDDDGFGVASDAKEACVAPPRYVASAGDCAPADELTYPGAPERCNGNDDNCNGQADDAPFVDVENPGQDGGVFDCQTGRPGVCGAGGVQCVFQGADAGFRPTCVARTAPAPDVCGNNVDEDCSGAADDRPGCGGPANVLDTPGISFGAFTVAPPGGLSVLPTTCLKEASGRTGMGWLSPSWVSSGTGAEVHVWWAEAPAGETWDVSTMTTLHLAMRTSPINPNTALGTWGTTRFPNAVVALCGAAGDVLRYRPSGAALVTGSTSPFFLDVPLRPGSGSPWAVTGALGTTLGRVKRVEVWMSPEPVGDGTTTTFTNRLLVDAGVPGFR